MSHLHRTHLELPTLWSLLGSVRGLKLLDAGCGEGEIAAILAARGAQVSAIDRDCASLLRGRQLHPHVEWLEGDVRELPFADQAFDRVLSHFVLDHLAEPAALRQAMREACRVLKPDGEIILATLHPFRPLTPSTPLVAHQGLGDSYYPGGRKLEIAHKSANGTWKRHWQFHWTLSDLFGALTQAGFAVTDLVEPLPSPQQIRLQPLLDQEIFCPLDLYMKAVKRPS